MRFCQADGTPLVEKSEPVDPYKTMVALPDDIKAVIPPPSISPSVREEPPPEPPMPEPSIPAPLENELLEIPPAVDPNKTQFVSEKELRAEMDAQGKEEDEQLIDMPSATPAFSEPESPFGDSTPPPSPFAAQNDLAESQPPEFSKTSPPIPSPFDPKPEPEKLPEPGPPAFVPTAAAEPSYNPFEQQPAEAAPMAQAEFNPPPVAESNMQNPQNFGQSAPAAGQNSTLAIVSLVLGILGLTVCCGSFVISLAAVITGFMARGKANQNPMQYGGAGLALGGLITGVLGLVGSVIVWIIYVFYFAAIMASMPR